MSNQLTLDQKKIAANLLAGLSLADIAEALGVPLDTARADMAAVLDRWAVDGDKRIELAQLNRLVNGIWEKAIAGDTDAIRTLLQILDRKGEIQEGIPDDPFGASLNLPGQVESREAYKLLEATATQGPWWDDYLALRRERTAEGKQRWNWREAVYIAWASLPKRLRWPETQEELARQVLGLTNDRTIREWKLKRPEIQERIVQLTGDVAMKHRAEVLDALVQVATMADPKAHPDRRLFMEWAGIYKPGQRLEHSGPDGGPIEIMEMSGLTDEQLARIAVGEDPRQVIQ